MNINGDLILAGNLLPAETNKYNLGSSSQQWLQTYTKYLSVGAGDISSLNTVVNGSNINFKAVISGDFHTTGISLFDDLLRVKKTGTAAVFGGEAVNISSAIYAPTAGIQIQAGSGGNTNSAVIGFHNPNISSSVFGYYQIDANNGQFRMRSDDTYWDLSLGGTVKLTTPWGKANLLVGEDGSDKIIAGYLASSTNGVVIGAHNSALTAWAPLNVSGSYVNIRRNETIVAKFLDGCLSLFPLYNDYREGIRIHSYGSWSDILLCGNDNTGDTGTSANSWFIGNNNGTFNITRNGSSTGTAYLRCVDNKWYINTTTGGEQLNIGGWVGTVGNTGWYSITYGGGWYMTDSNFIRNCNSKAVSININSNNAWGIGSHRLAAVFKGNDHVSILLSTNTLGYGLCVNNNGNWYWGKRTSNSETSTSGDTYLLQGDTTLIKSSTNMAIGLGQVKSSEFSNAYIRAVNARHLDASGVYSSDMDLYIGYGNNTPTQKTLFYYSTGTHGAAATSRTQFAEVNSNGLYALTRFGVNGQNTGYNFYVNGTSYFTNYLQTTSYFKSTVATGTSPVQVASTTVNANLNADLLDGYHESAFLRYSGWWSEDGQNVNDASGMVFAYSKHGLPGSWGIVTTFDYSKNSAYRHQIYGDGWNNEMYFRTRSSDRSGWNAWRHLLDNVNYPGILDNSYVKKSGDTMTGNLTLPSLNTAFKFNNSDIPEGAANLTSTATAHTMTLYRNGITIPYQMDNTNDGGMIRVRGTSESNCILELGTWDDSGAGETIQFNYYPTTSQVTPTYSVTVPKKSGTIALVGDNDAGFVKKSGDTMTGTLSVTGNGTNADPSVAAIEVRECGRVGTAQTTNVYAPRLGFHWGGRWWCQLALQDGRLKVYDASMNGLFPFQASQVYGAVWNDYAEYRLTSKVTPGQCVIETGLGDLVQSTKRLQPGANIVSDTFGFAIGETEQTKTPLAVSGRVLAYPYEDRYSYSAGDPVCSGPNGTISKMTRKEVREYPDRIVGTVSEIPEYETWGTGNVKVNGRIWIKVK